MGKIKIDTGLFSVASRNKDIVPCVTTPSIGCNCTSAMLIDTLQFSRSNIMSFYNGPKCQHGKVLGSEPLVAYLLDNYYEPAIKFTDTGGSLISLLGGCLAILFIERSDGQSSQFDIWNGHGLTFEKVEKLTQIRAKRIWVWAMGAASKAMTKHHNHHNHQARVVTF